MAMDWSKLAGLALQAGATVYSAKQNQKAIQQAQDAQTQAAQQAQQSAAQNATAAQERTQAALLARQQAAEKAQASVRDVLSQDPTTLPGYQFTRQQGEDAIARSLRAAGQMQSGAAMKELQQFNTNLADSKYGENFNRGLSVAQLLGNYGIGAADAGLGAAGTMSGYGTGATNAGITAGQNAADAASSARLMQGQNQNALLGGLAETFTSPGNMQTIKDMFAGFYKKKPPADPQDQYPNGYLGAR